jgi:major membrane immunogen (membrane-anchored lipoprotein)
MDGSMKIRKTLRVRCFLVVLAFAFAALGVGATSTSTSTVVKDGRKITTKIKTDNKGTKTTTVTVKEKDGTVSTTTTVTDRDGNILSTDDPDARAKADAARRESEERRAELERAPRRSAGDPIQVALFQTVVSEDLRKATNKEGVFPYLRREFDDDAVIQLMDQGRVDRYAKDHDFRTGQYTSFSSFEHGTEFLPVDVYVESFAKIEQKVGINKSTGKLGSAPFLVYTARITSEYGGAPIEVQEEGFILANLQVTKTFAAKIKAAVRDRIGPEIPLDTARFRRASQGLSREQIDATEALRSLFRKK